MNDYHNLFAAIVIAGIVAITSRSCAVAIGEQDTRENLAKIALQQKAVERGCVVIEEKH